MEIGTKIEMDNGRLGIQQGIIIEDDIIAWDVPEEDQDFWVDVRVSKEVDQTCFNCANNFKFYEYVDMWQSTLKGIEFNNIKRIHNTQ